MFTSHGVLPARPCGIILVLAALAAGGFLFPAAALSQEVV